MRIQSPYKDYYDSIQSYGQDQGLVYYRYPETKKVTLGGTRYQYRDGGVKNYSWTRYTIGFCGQLYLAFQFVPYHGLEHERRAGTKTFYNVADIHKFLAEHSPTTLIKPKKRFYSSDYINFEERYEKFHEHRGHKFGLGVFQEYRTPIFSLQRTSSCKHDYELEINCQLRQLEFQRVFDSNSCYQQLFMYLANQASPEKPIPKIDDETMAEAKGFDRKQSFRRMPRT